MQNLPKLESLSQPGQKKLIKRNASAWDIHEDEILRELVSQFSPKKWARISNGLNHLVHQGESMRTPRMCRERWCSYANPNLSKTEWSQEDDESMLFLYGNLGKKWSKISQVLKNHSEHQVKNRFYML
jgi:hypothetical protein